MPAPRLAAALAVAFAVPLLLWLWLHASIGYGPSTLLAAAVMTLIAAVGLLAALGLLARRRPHTRRRQPLRSAGAVVGAGAIALLLAGCPRHTPPAQVPFPDDPRVLHGPWRVHTTGLLDGTRDFIHAPEARRLLVWLYDHHRVFEFGDEAGWVEQDGLWTGATSPELYDPTLEALVAVDLMSAEPRIRVTPLDGSAVTTAEVVPPLGHTVVSVARGSGRSFALTRDGAGGQHLTWWDSLSGTAGGTRAVESAPDEVRASSNGRMLALWNLGAWRVTLIDTAAPEVSRALRLGACRGNGLGEASADGRWFLLADCFDNLRLADLSAAELGSFGMGVRPTGRPTFAAAGAEVVWLDEEGVVHAYHPVTRSRAELARLGDDEVQELDPWLRPVYVHRSADLLAVLTGRGTVRLRGLAGAVGWRAEAELPPLALSGATLDLAADPIDAGGADAYGFTGTFMADGADEPLPLTGSVHAQGLHEYHPRPSEVAAAALPPPHLSGEASVVDPVTAAERFRLGFSTSEREATSFEGPLHVVDEEIGYRVRVVRSA